MRTALLVAGLVGLVMAVFAPSGEWTAYHVAVTACWLAGMVGAGWSVWDAIRDSRPKPPRRHP